MRLQAALVVASLLGLAACGNPAKPTSLNPVVTSQGPATLTGTWRGWYQITSCVTTSIGCSGAPISSTVPFVLSVTDGPGGPVGTFQGESPSGITFVANVSGTPQPGGVILFTGAEPPKPPTATSTLDGVELRLTPGAATGFSGSVRFVYHRIDVVTVTATIAAASLDASPPPPNTPAASDPVGTWVGTAQVDACAGPLCHPHSGSYALTVVNRSGGFAALLTMDVNGGIVAELAGTRGPDNVLHFTGGSAAAPTPELDNRASVVRAFDVVVSDQAGLSGAFSYVYYAPTSSATTLTGRITSGARRSASFSPGSFEGGWRGYYVVTECVGDCDQGAQQVGRDVDFAVELSQAGNSIAGWFIPHSFPVSGTFSSALASLAGERIVDNCPPSDYEGVMCTQRLINLSASIDEFAVMHGTIQYHGEGSKRGQYAFTATGVLWNVVRQW